MTIRKAVSKRPLKLMGRSTSSKTLGIVSDMHVGSVYALASGYYGKITPDQQIIKDWWLHCSDKIGRCDLLLENGEPIEGSHYKNLGYELSIPATLDQIDDAERLLKMWKYDKILFCRGSKYHSNSEGGHSWAEEDLARKMGAVQYQGVFGKGSEKQGYSGEYTDMYAFFEINQRTFLANHEIGFSKQKASRTGAISRALINMELERGRWYDQGRNLDCLINSHNHYYIEVKYANPAMIGVITGCFKNADSHLHHGSMASASDIGACAIIVEQNSEILVKPEIMPAKLIPKPKVVRI